jgi:DNA repair exonuclease SbcCD nuclease subunit
MSKLGIFTDIHLGIFKDSQDQLNESLKVVEFIIDESRKRQVRRLCFLGDWFHSRSFVNVFTQNVGIDLLLKLKAEFDLTLIVGNHDSFFSHNNNITSLKFLDLVKDQNIKLISETAQITIDDKDILLLPWLGTTLDLNKKFDIILTHANAETNTIKNYFAKLKNIEKTQVDESIINTYLLETGMIDSPSSDSIDQLEKVNNSKFKTTRLFDLLKDRGVIFSGHFHIHDQFERFGKKFMWVGSPLELTWADEGNQKGFCVLDINTLETEFIENTFSPKHKKVLFSSIKEVQDEDIIKSLKHHNNNFIKIIFDISASYEDRARIYNLVQRFGNVKNIEIDSTLNQTGIISPLSTNESSPISSKFEYVEKYVDTFPEIEFTNRNVEKPKLMEMLKNYYGKALNSK